MSRIIPLLLVTLLLAGCSWHDHQRCERISCERVQDDTCNNKAHKCDIDVFERCIKSLKDDG